MRYVQASFLLVFLGALGIFAVQNTQTITVQFLRMAVTAPLALVSVAIYLLGNADRLDRGRLREPLAQNESPNGASLDAGAAPFLTAEDPPPRNLSRYSGLIRIFRQRQTAPGAQRLWPILPLSCTSKPMCPARPMRPKTDSAS